MAASKEAEAAAVNELSDNELSIDTSGHDGPWLRFLTWVKWYPQEYSHLEKKLVLKLDLLILVFGCLSFFTKYLDQAAITNAYVSGMEADLNLTGNDINYITAVFWVSYCTSMIPFCYFLTRTRINVALPTLEIFWGLFTFGCAWAQNIGTIYAMRFLVGLAESASFTGVIFVIGSWYKPGEITRRVAFYFTASPLGTMFAGYLQAAAYTNLSGTNGLEGWRWLFIICTIITLPVSILGYIVFPDVPSRGKPRFLSQEEHALGLSRLKGITAPSELNLSWSIFKRVLGRWHWYVFVLHWALMDQNFMPYSTPFSLYLKAKEPLYTVQQVNTIPTIATAVSVVSALGAALLADKLRNYWLPSVLVTIPVLIGIILLNVWNIGEIGRVAAFIIIGFEGAISPLSMTWASIVLANDAEERAVVTASMNAIGQAMTAWSQLLQWPAVQAPRFKGGFISALVTTILQFGSIALIALLSSQELRKRRSGHISSA
ncbi:putative allantoate permease [Xylariales sp. PMI_506]|nr:putative allantoate permease [Xylariales sp. PMI_506]